jgi:hypothetical protein
MTSIYTDQNEQFLLVWRSLEACGLGAYGPKFFNEEITIDCLSFMDRDHLDELNIATNDINKMIDFLQSFGSNINHIQD